MPNRPQQHQLADISVTRFKALLPAAWVCREKDRDYGIDLEVEIFDEDGTSTGLLFYVQVRATDNVSLKDNVSMKLDQLHYIESFESPTIIARYCRPTDTFYWIWSFNAFIQVGREDQKTVTLRFDEGDLWQSETHSQVVRTLSVRRTVKSPNRKTNIYLIPHFNKLSTEQTFTCNRAIARVLESCRFFRIHGSINDSLPIDIKISNERLSIFVDVAASVTYEIDESDLSDMVSKILYGIVMLLERYQFDEQAEQISSYILSEELITNTRLLGAIAASTLKSDPVAAVKLAVLNTVHTIQDEAYAGFAHSLLSSHLDHGERSYAIESFYTHAIESISGEDKRSAAPILYSLANFQFSIGKMLQALQNFNKARKLYPAYEQKDYYLRELGALLFLSGKYRCALKLYKAAYDFSPTPKVILAYGDALLYTGNFSEARSKFVQVLDCTDRVFVGEAFLRHWLSEWIENFWVAANSVANGNLSDIHHWERVARSSFDERRFRDALGATVMIAFLLEEEERVWADALMASALVGDIQVLAATMSCSIMRCGYDAYSLFREKVAAVVKDDTMLDVIDEISADFYRDRQSRTLSEIALRELRDGKYDMTSATDRNDLAE